MNSSVIPICCQSHSEHRGHRDDTRERAAAAPVVPIPADCGLMAHWYEQLYARLPNVIAANDRGLYHGIWTVVAGGRNAVAGRVRVWVAAITLPEPGHNAVLKDCLKRVCHGDTAPERESRRQPIPVAHRPTPNAATFSHTASGRCRDAVPAVVSAPPWMPSGRIAPLSGPRRTPSDRCLQRPDETSQDFSSIRLTPGRLGRCSVYSVQHLCPTNKVLAEG